MTDKYDPNNPEHEAIRFGIERGNGISNMVPARSAYEAMTKAGFEIKDHEDLAKREDAKPWYAPLAGTVASSRNIVDFFGYLRMTHLGRFGIACLLHTLEFVRLAPTGTAQTAAELSAGGDALVLGGEHGLFTPMYLMIGKKPAL